MLCVSGVLRGIDMVRGLYFLLTPVDPAILRKVNCLLLGGIVLPSCVLTAQVRPRPSSLALGLVPPKTIYTTLLFCFSAWLWCREALHHLRLQFWPDRCREAASLQGTNEAQSTGDVTTLSFFTFQIDPVLRLDFQFLLSHFKVYSHRADPSDLWHCHMDMIITRCR